MILPTILVSNFMCVCLCTISSRRTTAALGQGGQKQLSMVIGTLLRCVTFQGRKRMKKVVRWFFCSSSSPGNRPRSVKIIHHYCFLWYQVIRVMVWRLLVTGSSYDTIPSETFKKAALVFSGRVGGLVYWAGLPGQESRSARIIRTFSQLHLYGRDGGVRDLEAILCSPLVAHMISCHHAGCNLMLILAL